MRFSWLLSTKLKSNFCSKIGKGVSLSQRAIVRTLILKFDPDYTLFIMKEILLH